MWFRNELSSLAEVSLYCSAGQATDDNTIRPIRFACWIPQTSHSQYATLIALPLQQCFYECASCYIYTHSSCPVNYEITCNLNLGLTESRIWSQEKCKEYLHNFTNSFRCVSRISLYCSMLIMIHRLIHNDAFTSPYMTLLDTLTAPKSIIVGF